MSQAWWRRGLRAIADEPLSLRLVLLGTAVVHGAGLTWGLPASDGWDVDGVAPRDVFPGVALTFTPGHYFTYPPLHLAILAVLTSPVLLAAVAHAGTTQVPAVIHAIIAPVYMTPIALVARIASLVMSMGVVYAIAKIAGEIAPGRRRRVAAALAGALAAVGMPFTYYSHATNLDVPYLFWAWLALLACVRALRRGEPRRLRRAAVLAALAVCTKDQAYAVFLLSMPLVVALWALVDRGRARSIGWNAMLAAASALAVVLVVDGALFNPRGFMARLAFLTGPASRDYATYAADAVGRESALADTLRAFTWHYPLAVAPFVILGMGTLFRPRRAVDVVAAWVPLLAAISFTLAFNLVALRVEHRFTLPQMLTAAVYGGIGLERVTAAFDLRRTWARAVGWAVAGAVMAPAAWMSLTLDANLIDDPRYDAERWLRAHATDADTIEVHGLSVYLIRFWPGAHVVRVDPAPVDRRNPMAGITEVQAPVSAIEQRRPRFIVSNDCSAGFYLGRARGGPNGRIEPTSMRRDDANADATAFFRGLFANRLAYHLAHESRFESDVFERADLHASVSCPVYVFERNR